MRLVEEQDKQQLRCTCAHASRTDHHSGANPSGENSNECPLHPPARRTLGFRIKLYVGSILLSLCLVWWFFIVGRNVGLLKTNNLWELNRTPTPPSDSSL